MSAKIDVRSIITGHFNTLRDATSGKILKWDYFTFFILPALVAVLGVFFGFKTNEQFIGLLVNFGSIFTALLLSVLVLVFDKESNIDLLPRSSTNDLKKKILKELYFNICYTIVISMFAVIFSLLYQIIPFDNKNPVVFVSYIRDYFFTPVFLFIVMNAFFSILMIVKRMHVMLTAP